MPAEDRLRCECGKLYSFDTKEAAWDFVKNGKTKLNLVNVHPCRISKNDVWHMTTTIRSGTQKLSLLEQELHEEMSSVREMVEDYIDQKYKNTGDYKCSTAEIRVHLTKTSKNIYSPGTVSACVSSMRKDGILTELERIPNVPGRPSHYFTLTSILDKVTKPKKESNEVSKVVAVPEQKTETKPVPVNPFDKVNTQLTEILAKVNGLAQGYSQLVQHSQAVREALSQAPNGDVSKKLDEILTAATSHVTVDGDKLADVINNRLKDANDEGSLFFTIHKSINYEAERILELLPQDLGPMTPSTVANADDYQRGLKDGIRLAVEMGLKING